MSRSDNAMMVLLGGLRLTAAEMVERRLFLLGSSSSSSFNDILGHSESDAYRLFDHPPIHELGRLDDASIRSRYQDPRLRSRIPVRRGRSAYAASLLHDLHVPHALRHTHLRMPAPHYPDTALVDDIRVASLRPCGEWLCPLEPPSTDAFVDCPLCADSVSSRTLLPCSTCAQAVCIVCHLRTLHAAGPYFSADAWPTCGFCRSPYSRTQIAQLSRVNQAHLGQLPFRFYPETPPQIHGDSFTSWDGTVDDDDDRDVHFPADLFLPLILPSSSRFFATELNELREPPPIPARLRMSEETSALASTAAPYVELRNNVQFIRFGHGETGRSESTNHYENYRPGVGFYVPTVSDLSQPSSSTTFMP